MQENELIKIADGIFLDFVKQDITPKEAIKILQIADGKIRTLRAAMFSELEGVSLKEALKKKADGYGAQCNEE